MSFDAIIIGGGPAGLAAALTLGRARKRILLVDGGPRRNAAAAHVHNFVTRDGITPADFRRIGRQQLETYPNVTIKDEIVQEIGGERGAFDVRLETGNFTARCVLLCTGMIDSLPEVNGFRDLWGKSIFICPYCHAWEVQDRRFGYFAQSAETLHFALLLRGWTSKVTVFTNGAFGVPAEIAEQFVAARIAVDERRVINLRAEGDQLQEIEFATDDRVPLDVLFLHPRQRQSAIVDALCLKTDPKGYVLVDDLHRETSVPGIYAAGDLISPMQTAISAASSGSHAAGMLNHALTVEVAINGEL